MKQLSKKFIERLNAQAEEAENIGATHIANHLTEQIVKNAEIKTAKITYDSDEYEQDIESCVWDAVVATASFHGITNFDALEIQGFVEKFAEDLRISCRNQMKIKTTVGSYENKVPGEQ